MHWQAFEIQKEEIERVIREAAKHAQVANTYLTRMQRSLEMTQLQIANSERIVRETIELLRQTERTDAGPPVPSNNSPVA